MCASGDFAVCFLLKQTNTSQVKCHELKTVRSQERGAKSNECTSKLIFVVNCTNRERTNKLAVRAKEFKSRKGEEPSRAPASDHDSSSQVFKSIRNQRGAGVRVQTRRRNNEPKINKQQNSEGKQTTKIVKTNKTRKIAKVNKQQK